MRLRRRCPHESGRVPLVVVAAVVGEVPRPVQAGVGAGRSDLRVSSFPEPRRGTSPQPHRLCRRQRIPLIYRRAFAVFDGAIGFLLLIGFYVLIGTTLVTAVNHAIVGAAGVLVGGYVLRKFTPEWWFAKY